MSAISAATLTSISVRGKDVQDKFYHLGATISFGDGALTYPAGGIPVAASLFGFRNTIRDLVFVDAANANGYIYKFDSANKKIRIYQGDNAGVAAGPLVELGGTDAPAATSLVVRVEGY